MILTVTLNATLQVSYEAPEISWGETDHIRQLISRAGGGGLAVARVLAGLLSLRARERGTGGQGYAVRAVRAGRCCGPGKLTEPASICQIITSKV